jgi:hypothetical protein
MHCRNNNDNHNNNYCESGYDIMCTAFQHEEVLLMRIYEPPFDKQRTF